MQVFEYFKGDLSRGLLGRPGEYGVAKLLKQDRAEPKQPVANQQCNRYGQDRLCSAAHIEAVDYRFERDRNGHTGQFCKYQQAQCEGDPCGELPQVG